MLAEPDPIEGVEKINVIMVYSQQQVVFVPRYNLYIIDINRRKNCYNCEGFRHMARNCKNWRAVEQGRMISYQENNDNLKENKNLIVLD